VLVTVGPVAAGDFRGAQTVSIAEGETIDDDLYVAAGMITIDGTVNGDAMVAGGTVTVSGTITGSLNVGGGTVDVLGDVEGAVRVSGGTVRLAGTVGRDAVIFGGTASIEPGAEVSGDVAGGTGSLTIGGTVGGDVMAGTGSLRLTGTSSVAGSVEGSVNELVIESGASVDGDVRYTSAREAQIADGAEIGGEVERSEPEPDPTIAIVSQNPVLAYLGLLAGMLIFGWTLLAIRPRLVIGSGEAIRTASLPALGLGLAAFIGQWVLLILLIVVGALLGILAGAVGGAFIIAAMVLLLLIIIVVVISSVPVAMAIGRLVLRGDGSAYLAYLVGAAILAGVVVLAGLLPALGGIVTLVIWILGLGAFVVYLTRTRNDPWVAGTSAPVADAPPPAPAPAG
jgi:cytoskeletal protein CcmA (bactofilin family)